MFEIGALLMTRGVNERMNSSSKDGEEEKKASRRFRSQVYKSVSRYMSEDWGEPETKSQESIELFEYTKQENDAAVKHGDRILATYNTCKGVIWIITDANRTATTVMFPDEY